MSVPFSVAPERHYWDRDYPDHRETFDENQAIAERDDPEFSVAIQLGRLRAQYIVLLADYRQAIARVHELEGGAE